MRDLKSYHSVKLLARHSLSPGTCQMEWNLPNDLLEWVMNLNVILRLVMDLLPAGPEPENTPRLCNMIIFVQIRFAGVGSKTFPHFATLNNLKLSDSMTSVQPILWHVNICQYFYSYVWFFSVFIERKSWMLFTTQGICGDSRQILTGTEPKFCSERSHFPFLAIVILPIKTHLRMSGVDSSNLSESTMASTQFGFEQIVMGFFSPPLLWQCKRVHICKVWLLLPLIIWRLRKCVEPVYRDVSLAYLALLCLKITKFRYQYKPHV